MILKVTKSGSQITDGYSQLYMITYCLNINAHHQVYCKCVTSVSYISISSSVKEELHIKGIWTDGRTYRLIPICTPKKLCLEGMNTALLNYI